MTSRLSKLRHLSRTDVAELVSAVIALLGSRLLLATVSSRTGLRVVGSLTKRSKRRSTIAPDRVVYLVRAANHGSRLRFACLPLSVATWARLRRHGHRAELRIGAPLSMASDGFEAHAWVELDGQPIGEPGDVLRRYAPLGDPVAGRR